MSHLPNWWFRDEDESPHKKSEIPIDNVDLYDIKFPKKKKKHHIDISSKSDNQVIKELSELLIYKDNTIDGLETKLSHAETNYEETRSELKYLKKEYNRIYNENCLLKDIISKLDSNKPKMIDNPLFLSEKAPKDIVEAVFKILSKSYHPDCGGSDEQMKSINLARDKFYSENKWS
jgi:hypothetical protein